MNADDLERRLAAYLDSKCPPDYPEPTEAEREEARENRDERVEQGTGIVDGFGVDPDEETGEKR